MRTRSTTPLKLFSLPIGSSIGITFLPNALISDSSTRSAFARSRSMRFTTISRGVLYSSQSFHTRCVTTSTPATPSRRPPVPAAALLLPCKAWPRAARSSPHAHAPPSRHYEYFPRNRLSPVGSFAGVEKQKAQNSESRLHNEDQHSIQASPTYLPKPRMLPRGKRTPQPARIQCGDSHPRLSGDRSSPRQFPSR